MAKRRKQGAKVPVYGIFMLIYIIVGVILCFHLWNKLEKYLIDLEASLPKYGMDEVMAAISENRIDDIIRQDTLETIAKYEGLEEYRSLLKEKLSSGEVTMQESKQATKEVPRYTVLAGGQPVMDVSLKVVGKNDHDLDLWGYDKFYADDYSIGDTVYEVTVPDGSVVTVNGHTLTDADIAKDENGDPKVTEIADLKVIEQYLDHVPSFITYAVEGFIVEPRFSAVDKDGNAMDLTRDGNSYSAGLPTYPEAVAEVEALVPTIMEAYGLHFIGKNTGGVYKYLLPDSQYKEDVKSVVTYFYPTEKITSYEFGNESCDNFITYTPDCVSCHIYFDLIVKFNSAAYKTKNEGSDATWIFLKRDGTWYLSQVLRQKSIEYDGD